MHLLDREIELVIFDLDGTLVDSTSLWSDIDTAFFAKRNKEVPPTYFKEIAHIGLSKAAELTKEKYCPNEEVKDIINEWHEMSLDAYENHIPLKDYVVELLELLKSLNVKIALATANSEDLYLPLMKRTNIIQYFDYIVDVNDCTNGKNSPEIFFKVSEHFNIPSSHSVVVEDNLLPLKTCFENGFLTIGINDKITVLDPNENKKYSHLFIDNFMT